MEHNKYELSEALRRMDSILESKGDEYRQYKYIPQEGMVEGHRGYFVDCSVIVARLYFNTNDIKVLGLAKVYDIYVNEAKLILAENDLCRKVIVHGNSIAAIYDVGAEGYLNGLMDVAARISSLPDVINTKAGRRTPPLLGNVCALETGYLYATRSDDGFDFFGGMLNRAEQWIMKKDDADSEQRGVFISQKVRDGLKEQYQQFFKLTDFGGIYHGMVENIGMAKWIKEQ